MPFFLGDASALIEVVSAFAGDLPEKVAGIDHTGAQPHSTPTSKAIRSPSPPSRGLYSTPILFPCSPAAIVEENTTLRPTPKPDNFHNMPTLPPSDFDEEELDELLSVHARASAAPEPKLAATPTPTVESSPDDTQSDEESPYLEILWDAKNTFAGQKPAFVQSVGSVKFDDTKLVGMENDNIAEMTFTVWNDANGYGYWLLEDNLGLKHIVKYFNKGRCYREWLGSDEGFSEDPIAWPITRHKSSPSFDQDGADFEENGISIQHKPTPTSSKNLRQKTFSQVHPYKAEKEVFETGKREGWVKHASEIDEREAKRQKSYKLPSPSSNIKSRGAVNSKQRRYSSSSRMESEPPQCTAKPDRAHVDAKTSLLTKLPPDVEPCIIFLSDCPDVQSLWDNVVAMWESDIDGTVKSMSIKFPWLGPEYNIKLKPGLAGSYQKLIEEIIDAPFWSDGIDKCSVEIILNVV